MLSIPSTPFQWQSWDCFTLVNWIRTQNSLPPIKLSGIYDLYPTVDSFHKDALLSIVPKIGLQQQGISHLNVLVIESFDGEFTLGTAIAMNDAMYAALMGSNHAHLIPLDRLPVSSITAWIPHKTQLLT